MKARSDSRAGQAGSCDLVLLHGFGGTRRTWDLVLEHLPAERYNALALDLPGHGSQADASRPVSFKGCVASVLERSPPRFALVGYSLGGRVALHVAFAAPERVARLVLIGANPGIEDPAERRQRRDCDRLLAKRLEVESFEGFIERWRAQPLFAEDPPEVGRLARADQRRNRPNALAQALRGLSVGEMRSLWDRLGALEMPVTVIAGERDAKFRAIGERMVALLGDGRLVVLPGGHGLALESPRELAAAISQASRPVA